jgi:hypothetical protein
MSLVITIIAFECLFLVKMFVKSVSTFVNPVDACQVVKNNRKIFQNYLQTTFYMDFIAIIPFQLFPLKNGRHSLWYLLKLLRLLESYKEVNEIQDLMLVFRIINKKIWEVRRCDCRDEDHNKIEKFHLISYALRLVVMILNIFNFTYCIAMIWYIFCVSIEDFYVGADYGTLTKEQIEAQGLEWQFIIYFQIRDNSYLRNV